jgi:hypothetical protein
MDKRGRIGLLLCLAILGCIALVAAENGAKAPKGENGTIVGQVIDIADYAMFGRLGEAHAASGAYRAEHGFPVAILGEDGTVWIAVYRLPVPAAGLQTANDLLGPLMGKQVVVQGLLYRAPGISLIRVALAREM